MAAGIAALRPRKRARTEWRCHWKCRWPRRVLGSYPANGKAPAKTGLSATSHLTTTKLPQLSLTRAGGHCHPRVAHQPWPPRSLAQRPEARLATGRKRAAQRRYWRAVARAAARARPATNPGPRWRPWPERPRKKGGRTSQCWRAIAWGWSPRKEVCRAKARKKWPRRTKGRPWCRRAHDARFRAPYITGTRTQLRPCPGVATRVQSRSQQS
mmetsp:Transcript_86472/g.242027  ORF Transcript_86472/g.242027 Transcript_86472/m.242027 type:complete len:212 (-) Transcript_86472:577-1212(-)